MALQLAFGDSHPFGVKPCVRPPSAKPDESLPYLGIASHRTSAAACGPTAANNHRHRTLAVATKAADRG
jgi:hypothetical protein